MVVENSRTAPASVEANNNDVFMWAVYLLGGESRQVDVEDIYFTAFELAPARLGWRTRPDVPNFKKTAKALQAIEAVTHVGLLQKLGANFRRLTPDGARWINENKGILQSLYSSGKAVEPPKNSDYSRARTAIVSSQAWSMWSTQGTCSLPALAFALRLSPSSLPVLWMEKLANLEQLAARLDDDEFKNFAMHARSIYEKEEK